MVKLCECGCGRETNLIEKNNTLNGYIKENYFRFVKGHHSSRIGQKFPKELYPNYGMRNKANTEASKKISENHKRTGIRPPSPLGKHWKIKDTSKMGRPKGIIFTLEHRQKLKKARAKRIIPIKDSLPEKKIQNILKVLHIEFLTHYWMSNIKHRYQCDILIPKQTGIPKKTIIECDGCYWHGCPICKLKSNENIKHTMKKDKIRTKELIEKGFKVIRLWEHEIKTMQVNDLRNTLK